MEKKKKFRRKKMDTRLPDTKVSVLFYASSFSDAEISHIHESLKRIRKEYLDTTSFFILSENDENLREDGSHLNLTTREKFFKEVLSYGADYIYILNGEGIKRNINLNDLIGGDFRFPDQTGYSRVYFTGQPLNAGSSLLLGRKAAEYLAEVPMRKETALTENINWYLHRLHQKESRIITDQEYPLAGKKKKPKWIPYGPGAFKRWFRWNFSHALREHREQKSSPVDRSSPLLRPAFYLAALLTLVILPVISYNAGISGDEEKHYLHAEKVYNYFESDGADTLALNDPRYKLNYYGQSFDLFTYLFIKTFDIEKIYETRHVLNGLTGALAIITTAFLVRLLAGNFAGLLTFFLLFFSPRFLGHAMNNPLDIPFALGYIFTTLQTIRFLRRLPEFSANIAFLITLGVAYTISIRIGGLILIPYLLLFGGLYLLVKRWPWKFMSAQYLHFAGRGLVYLGLISVVSYFLSILPWPYALQAPLENPFNSLDMMANITVALRVMFEGEIIWSDHLPWYYIPKNILLTVPILILILFAVPAFLFLKKRKDTDPFWIFVLYFSVIFPVVYIIYKESNVYGGWRHLLFVYPSMVVLAAVGAGWIKDMLHGKWIKTAFVLLLVMAMTGPALHIFRNYPLQYIYFNQLAGGVDKAWKKYETDYYLNSLKSGTDWVISGILEDYPPDSDKNLRIISNAPHAIMDYYFRDYRDFVDIPYTRYYDRGAYDWDYAVFFCNYIDPYQLNHNIWPPKNTIHEVKVDGVTVCAVVERKNRDDYRGTMLLRQGRQEEDVEKLAQGLRLLESAVRYDPYNEIAYLNLAHGYIMVGQYDRARRHLNSLLEIYPGYDKALNLLGYSFLSEGQRNGSSMMLDQSINIFSQTINVNYKFTPAYHNMGLAYMMKGEDDTALQYFNMALDINPNFRQSYLSAAALYERRGEFQKANHYRQLAGGL